MIFTGRNGFIGRELIKRNIPDGVYFFGSPSSNILFDEDITTCMRETIDGFINMLDRCKKTGEYLVYPSSATVTSRNTSYAHCKAILEELAEAYGIPSLGLRITAGYGPGEYSKGRYASVVYQWCKAMKHGERPIVFGDGTQMRDFVYIDDIVDNIEYLVNRHTEGIVDIGSRKDTSFNKVIEIINKVLGTHIKPIYVPAPEHYISRLNNSGCTTKVSLEEGIRKILNDKNL
jgi:nucleoside-diphosphate-sugar epimerase